MAVRRETGRFRQGVIGVLVCLSTICVTLGCATPSATDRISSDAATRAPASLGNEDLNTLESRLREIRGTVPPNYPDEPILLVKSDWPFEWRGYGNPFQLRPYEEVFPEVERQTPPELSTNELMLAFGWVHKNAEDYYKLSFEERLAFEKEHPQIEDRGFSSFQVHPAKEIAKNWLDYYIATGRKAERLVEVVHWRGCDKLILEGSPVECSDALDRITSPVTGDLMEIRHPQFSAGNMHIDAFTLQELEDNYGIDVSKFNDIRVHQGLSKEDTVVALYRVYGTKGVVKTGWILRSRSSQYTGAESF